MPDGFGLDGLAGGAPRIGTGPMSPGNVGTPRRGRGTARSRLLRCNPRNHDQSSMPAENAENQAETARITETLASEDVRAADTCLLLGSRSLFLQKPSETRSVFRSHGSL
jgi:hypothetical protein